MNLPAARFVTARRLGAIVALACGCSFASAHAQELTGLPAVIERIKPSIVAVGTTLPTRSPSYQFRGTGFVVGDGTLIATNNHVVPQNVDVANQEVLSIALPKSGLDAALRTATLVARDAEHDLALLRISGPPLTPVKVGDASRVHEGETYAFIGFPLGSAIGLFPTTHHALVSALTPITLPQPNARTLDPSLDLSCREVLRLCTTLSDSKRLDIWSQSRELIIMAATPTAILGSTSSSKELLYSLRNFTT